MTSPTMKVEYCPVDYTSTPTWIEITSDVRTLSFRRGRDNDRDPVDVGTLDLTLDNRDGRYDPTYTGSIRNYCSNPSFEVSTTGWVGTGSNAPTIVRTTGQYYTGAASLQVDFKGANSVAATDVVAYKSALTGKTITLSAYVKTTSTTVRVGLQTNYSSLSGNTAYSSYHTGGGGWERLSVTCTPTFDTGGTTSYIYCGVVGQTNPSTAYVDGYIIEIAASASTYFDGNTDNHRWSASAGAVWQSTAGAAVTYQGGPYYGYLTPLRRFRVSAVYSGTTYNLFYGYSINYKVNYDYRVPAESTVEIECTDGLGLFSLKQVNLPFPAQATHDRVNALCDEVSWTLGGYWVLGSATNSQLNTTTILNQRSADRVVNTGTLTDYSEGLSWMSVSEPNNIPSLSMLQDVQVVEDAPIYCLVDGKLRFESRARRISTTTSSCTVGDGGGTEIPYQEIEIVSDADKIVTEVTCSTDADDEVPVTVSDTTHLSYGRRSLNREGIPMLALHSTETTCYATWVLNKYKDPVPRVKSVMFPPHRNETNWPTFLARDLGDRITVNRRFSPLSDHITTGYYFIDGIEMDVENPAYGWTITWKLSPLLTDSFWHVGSGTGGYFWNTYSVLGTTTKLAH